MNLGSPLVGKPGAVGYSGNLTIKKEFTKRQKRAFAGEAFEYTARHFEKSLKLPVDFRPLRLRPGTLGWQRDRKDGRLQCGVVHPFRQWPGKASCGRSARV